jgi:hypothetical protein
MVQLLTKFVTIINNNVVKMAFSKNKHLECVLSSHNMNVEEGTLLDNHKAKRDKVKKALEQHYGSKQKKIINSGSYAKHTAINTKFDVDLCIYFNKDAFKKLEIMHNDVYEFLNNNYKKSDNDLIKVRKQKVSIGLTFNVDGEDLLFDVTPGRKMKEDDNDSDINLYLNVEEANSKKTNVEKQIDNIKGRTKERECIKLLKVWKYKHNKEMKSFFVELFVIRAFDNKNIDEIKGQWERLKAVIEYMRDNILSINLEDPGNSNNNVADSLTEEEKKGFKEDFTEILEKIEADELKLKYYFPINEKYPCPDEEKKAGYNTTATGNPSKNPTPTFG